MNLRNKISEIKVKLSRNIFLKNIAVVAGGNFIAKALAVIAIPFLTRLYTPNDFGIFSIFTSTIGVLLSLVTLNYAVAIPIIKKEHLVNSALHLCFVVVSAFSLLLTLSVFFWKNYLITWFFDEKLENYLFIIPIVFFARGSYETLNSWAVRNKEFNLITMTRVSQSISSISTKVGLGYLGVVPAGLFLGYIAQELSGTITFLRKMLRVNPDFYRKISLLEIRFLAKRYRRFPLIQSWSQLLLVLAAQLPVILIGKYYGLKVAGMFALAQNMINMPMALIGQSVAQVYYSEISSYGIDRAADIHKLSVSIVKKLFILGVFPACILLISGPSLFEFVFGSQWQEAGVIAQIISFIMLFRFVSSPIMNIFNIFERQDIQLRLNIARVLFVFATFYSCFILGYSSTFALKVYSMIISLFYLFVIYYIINFIKDKICE